VKKLSDGEYYDIFFKIRNTFNNISDEDYAEYLYKGDQVLLNIALYLLENFKGDYKYFCDKDEQCTERCNYLNKWLNEKKALYTSNTQCKSHNDLWERYIEQLWHKMQEDVAQNKRCQRNISDKKSFKEKWIISSCNSNNPVQGEKECPHSASSSLPTPPALPLHPQERSCPFSVDPKTSSCKAFSSVGMKLNNLIRRKKIKRTNMDKKNNESFRSDNNSNLESIDKRFNVIYNSFQNY
ncbi:PIR Superfamily Protein, partial [Plasmodium ovale curtisi]